MWLPTESKKYGVAIYNWKVDTRFALPLEIGDTVQILEEFETEWYRGFLTKCHSIKGIFPQSYVHLKACKVDKEGLFESVVPTDDSVVREVTHVLREWGEIWKRLYVNREQYQFETVGKVMRNLLEWRRQLLSGTLTNDQTKELKTKIVTKIDWGNRKLGLDLVPRQNTEMIEADSMSIIELYHSHVASAENAQGVSSRGTIRRKEPKKTLTHHLHFCMRDFGHHFGEDTEIYFSLYDAANQKFISERFLVKISKDGFSNYIEKLHSNCTVFTDLGNADLNKDIVIVAHIIRVGRMLYSESAKKTDKNVINHQNHYHNNNSISNNSCNHNNNTHHHNHQMFRRPVGVAIQNIGDYLTSKDHDEEKEYTMRVYQTDEKDYHQLHEMLIRQYGKFSQISTSPNYGVLMSLKMLHGGLGSIQQENALLFKNVSLTSKLGFPDVIMPGDVRNDLYLHLERGEFERGGKSTGKNIEITVTVLDADRNIVQSCLWGGSGVEPSSHYNSMIIYHYNSPFWSENIRLTLPIDKFAGAHVRLEFRHCSTREKNDKKLFGFSFIRLMDKEGAVIRDGQHELYIYKCEDGHRLNSCSYLTLPIHSKDQECMKCETNVSNAFTRNQKELIYVKTMLCSTKLTQNVDLLALLRWKSHPERIQDSLQRVLRLGDEELVKFLQDVLDVLFALFSTEDGNSTAHSGPVFHVLVSIFNLLDGSKYQHFKPVLDVYIKNHFAAALVYKGLLTSVQHFADWILSIDSQEPIQKCCRSLEYIFKLIIQSRLLFSRATCGQLEDSFKRDLYGVFSSLNNMLTLNESRIVNTQVTLLLSISAVYEQLTDILPTLEVTKLALTLLECLPNDQSGLLVQAKLQLIKNLVTSKLVQDDDESRSILLANVYKHLKRHLTRRDELRLCTDILCETLSYLFKERKKYEQDGKTNNCLQHDIDTVSLNILEVLIQTVLIMIDKDTKVIGSLVASLLAILQILDECHYKHLWDVLMGPTLDRKPLKDFLLRVFLVFRNLVRQQEVYPSDWLVMKMTANHIILKAMQELAQPLAFKFLDLRTGYFDKELWTNYFNLAVDYLTQSCLQLEHFSDVKREKIIEKYGDMRVFMGFQILSMWSQLGECKLYFIPAMVGPFLEVTLVPELELRKATMHIFYDMMTCEQQAHGNFKQVETELIDKLDILISDNKGDDEYRRIFNTMLMTRVQTENPTWKDSGTAFINSVTRLLERLLDYRSVIQGDENRDKRMSCTFNLLNFYENEFNRKEMYLRYIYKLHDLHSSADNYTEAGCTMKLYADQLSWTNNTLLCDANFTNLTECQIKEKLYHQIIEHFDRGKCWEKGIPLLKELANIYESQLFDYESLSNTLKMQAKFYDNILTQLRPEPEYFRVGFYGLGFPSFVRNKQFVYRGLEYERIGAFTQRIQTEFPAAHILMKTTPPDDTILNSDDQYVQIQNVKPIPESNPITQTPNIPEKISLFYHYNDVKRFQCDRPIHKGIIDKENEIKTLWIERTTLQIEATLPGILRWYEVIDRQTDEIPPVRFACETMQNVDGELRRMLTAYKADPKRNLNPLTMRLQGVIDANVQGGISKYQQAFFTDEFPKLWPEHAHHAVTLRNLIYRAMQVIEDGLEVHGRLASDSLQPLHQRLLERFEQLKETYSAINKIIKKQLAASILSTPLPPVPIDKKSFNFENGSNHSSNSSGNYGYLSDHYTFLEHDDVQAKLRGSDGKLHPSRENLSISMVPVFPAATPTMATSSPPPLPHRPRSQGFNNSMNNSSGGLVIAPDISSKSASNREISPLFEYNSASLPLPKSRNSEFRPVKNSNDNDNVEPAPLPPPKPSLARERSLSVPDRSLSSPIGQNSENGGVVDEAPPLPPRLFAPDKRASEPPNIPKRSHKKLSSCSSLSISLDEDNSISVMTSVPQQISNSTTVAVTGTVLLKAEHNPRDSGISISSAETCASSMNNSNNSNHNFVPNTLNNRNHNHAIPKNNCSSPYEECILRSPCTQISPLSLANNGQTQSNENVIESPPPIPPKSSLLTNSLNNNSSLDFDYNTIENYSVPQISTESPQE